MEFTTHLELQSQATRLHYTAFTPHTQGTDGILTLSDVPFQGTYPCVFRKARMPQHPYKGFASWAIPASVALTEGILVSFFSSA